MNFWASAEVFQPAFPALDGIRRCVEPHLNAAFAASNLAALDCKVRYVPIVMPPDMHARYPARSKLRKKQRIYDCAPILDYAVFVDGAFEDQLREYLRGIETTAAHLAGLGASTEQVEEFKVILERAFERIVVDRPDQTRH